MENSSDIYGEDIFANNSGLNVTSDKEERVLQILDYPSIQSVFYIQYMTIFLLGVFGNCLVCYVVLKNKHMRTVTNFFIANLAISDILLCVLSVPFTPLYYFIGRWIFGSVLCHIVSMAQGVSVYVSTLTLTSIAIDRFFVIIYPFRPRLQIKACYSIIISIWVFSITATFPYALYIGHALIETSYYCEEFWPSEVTRQVFSLFTTLMQFIVPFTVILLCYVKISLRMNERVKLKSKGNSSKKDEVERERKRRMNGMLISMVTIFSISWLPINVFHLIQDYYAPAGKWPYTSLCFFITHLVAMSSTCYNPFLYAYLNENFRKEFQLVLPCFEKINPSMRRDRWRSERTCNGSHFTQHEPLTQTAVTDAHPSESMELANLAATNRGADSTATSDQIVLVINEAPPKPTLVQINGEVNESA